MVAFTAKGDQQWTALNDPPNGILLGNYEDVAVYKGKLHAVTEFGHICSWDIKQGAAAEATILVPPDIHIDHTKDDDAFYLASSSSGDLQLICMYGEKDDQHKDEQWMRVVNSQFKFFPRRIILYERDDHAGI